MFDDLVRFSLILSAILELFLSHIARYAPSSQP